MMKKLLTVLLVVLGTTMVNAQGYIGWGFDEMDSLFKAETEDYENGFTDEGIEYLSVIQNDKSVIVYFNDYNYVFVSVFIPHTQDVYYSLLESCDKYTKVDDREWHNIFDHGFVKIKIKDDPENRLPIFIITYNPY